MTDGEALRRAVLADPDEDTHRLVYADWLDENGRGDRAAFIRAQVEAARAEPFGSQARAAAKRADDILERYRYDWTRHLLGSRIESQRFERGFVAHLEIEPTAFLPHADALFSAEPLQSLRVFRYIEPTGFGEFAEVVPFQPIFELEQLRQVRRLEFAPMVLGAEDNEEFAALSGCPHLAGLRELSLRANPVPPVWLEAILAGEQFFPELSSLDLADNSHLGPALARVLPRAKHRSFRKLDVSRVVFTSDRIQQVLQSRCLAKVEELRLGCAVPRGDTGPLFHINIGWVIPWDRLVVLDLAGQRLGNESVLEIVRRPEAAALRYLGLAFNDLTSASVRALADSKHLKLNHLDVRGNAFTPNELATLRNRFPDALVES
jgi:uncharacterized protein (TIGR02996 family)